MPHTFFPDTVEFLSVVTETHRSHTKIQIFAYFNSSLISGKKKKEKESQIKQQQSDTNNHYHSDYVFWIFILICVISLGPLFHHFDIP